MKRWRPGHWPSPSAQKNFGANNRIVGKKGQRQGEDPFGKRSLLKAKLSFPMGLFFLNGICSAGNSRS